MVEAIVKPQETLPVQLQQNKTPGTRLLDMLSGWSQFVDAEEEVTDTCLSAEDIATLYQQAGEMVFDLPESDVLTEKQAVRAFVIERVLPILLQ